MSQEVNASINVSGNKNGITASISKSLQIDMTGAILFQNVQVINTTAEQIILGSGTDLTTCDFVVFLNLDATNYIEIALDSAVSTQKFAKLKTGQFAAFPPSTPTMYAKANTANCNMAVVGYGG